MKTIEAYEATATLKPNGVKLFGTDGHWLRDWNINDPEIRVTRVKLEIMIPADDAEPNRFADLWMDPEAFNALGLRRHDSVSVNLVVTGEDDLVVRDGKDDYKRVSFDVHDYELSVVGNRRVSERMNKPYPKLVKVELPKAGGSEEDE